MHNKVECKYSIACTLLNALFYSKQWMVHLLQVLPTNFREPFISLYHKCCANSVVYGAYLDCVFSWVHPSLRSSYESMMDVKRANSKKRSEVELMEETVNNTMLAEVSHSALTRTFAQLLLDRPA